MWAYLEETDFSKDNVILEEKLCTTYENLKNVREYVAVMVKFRCFTITFVIGLTVLMGYLFWPAWI